MIRNKYNITAAWCALIFGIISTALFITPSLAEIDGMDGGFAMIAIGVFLLIVGIITVVVFARMGKIYKSMSNFESILANWHINQAEYAIFAAYDVNENSKNLRFTRWMVIIITFIVGIFCAILGMELDFVIIFCLSLSVFIWLVSFLAILNQKRKLHKSEADIILAKDGGIINGTLHPWSKMNNLLESSAIIEIAPNLFVIEITYSFPNRGGRAETTARFPIPNGKLTEAQFILDEIRMS
jgi:hypothetical protein